LRCLFGRDDGDVQYLKKEKEIEERREEESKCVCAMWVKSITTTINKASKQR